MVMLAEHEQAHQAHFTPGMLQRVPAPAAQDEYSVDFDRTMIVYSDRVDCGQNDLTRLSPVTSLMLGHDRHCADERCDTGATTIGCYKGSRYVGSISFYHERERHPESSIDPEGYLSIWFPLACFPHVLNMLYHEKELSLALVRRDLDGRNLAPPLGALLTWPEPTGKEAEADS